MKFKISDYIGVSIVTVASLILMFTIGIGNGSWSWGGSHEAEKAREIVIPKTPVAVQQVEPELVEIVVRFAGMLRPFERHPLAFEVGGRVTSLGTNAAGKPLDVGDRVDAGQIIAELDARTESARLKRAKALLEKAQADLARVERTKERVPGAVTDAEYTDLITRLAEAEAETTTAEKALEDRLLITPVPGVISRRTLSVGESVNPHQAVFEVLETDKLLLVVGIPESRIQELRLGQRVHLELLARDLYGRPRPAVDGVVHEVAEASDQQTGLFEVEIVVDNTENQLKPGLIARANIVVDEVEAYRLPLTAGVFREGELFLFAIDAQNKAVRYPLLGALEQGSELIVRELPAEFRTVVVRGQHRLTDGREVEILDAQAAGSEAEAIEPAVEVNMASGAEAP
ncbi:MAG: efflux RND transporter periplasmic adaptor subunit [Pirellulales bacterium]|nr:efflux RND transporter periplasmic adaptor subunit [Pirellulales bacterium]